MIKTNDINGDKIGQSIWKLGKLNLALPSNKSKLILQKFVPSWGCARRSSHGDRWRTFWLERMATACTALRRWVLYPVKLIRVMYMHINFQVEQWVIYNWVREYLDKLTFNFDMETWSEAWILCTLDKVSILSI